MTRLDRVKIGMISLGAGIVEPHFIVDHNGAVTSVEMTAIEFTLVPNWDEGLAIRRAVPVVAVIV